MIKLFLALPLIVLCGFLHITQEIFIKISEFVCELLENCIINLEVSIAKLVED